MFFFLPTFLTTLKPRGNTSLTLKLIFQLKSTKPTTNQNPELLSEKQDLLKALPKCCCLPHKMIDLVLCMTFFVYK